MQTPDEAGETAERDAQRAQALSDTAAHGGKPYFWIAALVLAALCAVLGYLVAQPLYYAAIALAAWMYARDRQPVADRLAATFSGLHRAAYRRFYIDEVYQFITHRIIFGCICHPIAWWDRHVVDGFFNFLAWGAEATSEEIRGLQSGRIQQYTFVFLLGTLALILLLLL